MMNSAKKRHADNTLKSIFLVSWLDRAAPGSIKFCQHLLRRRAATIDDPIERLEMARLVPSGVVDAGPAPQAGMRQRQTFPGDFEQIAVPDPRLETETRHLVAQCLALVRVPALGDIPGGIQTDIVIEQSDPEGRQRRQAAPRGAVGAP